VLFQSGSFIPPSPQELAAKIPNLEVLELLWPRPVVVKSVISGRLPFHVKSGGQRGVAHFGLDYRNPNRVKQGLLLRKALVACFHERES
jgi:hypothetical protein